MSVVTIPNATVCGTCAAWVTVNGVSSPAWVTRGKPTDGKGPLTLRWGDSSRQIAGGADSFYAVATVGSVVAVAYSQGGTVSLCSLDLATGQIASILLGSGIRPALSWLYPQDSWGGSWVVTFIRGTTRMLSRVEAGVVAWENGESAMDGCIPDFPSIVSAHKGGAVAWREKSAAGFSTRVILGATGEGFVLPGLYDPSLALLPDGRVLLGAHAAGRQVSIGEMVASAGLRVSLSLPSCQFPHLSQAGGTVALAVAEYSGQDVAGDPDANRVAQRYLMESGKGWSKWGGPGYRTTHGGSAVSPDGKQVAWTWVDETNREAITACMEVVP